MAQGRAQVMRHRVAESFQLLVSRLKLAGALANAFFQFGVQTQDLLLDSLLFGQVASNLGKAVEPAGFVAQCIEDCMRPITGAILAQAPAFGFATTLPGS